MGSIDGINGFNRWYGDTPSYGKHGVTLLFPTATRYQCTAKNKDTLNAIILDPSNWEYAKYYDDAEHYIFTDKTSELKSIDDYYDYLHGKNKI